MTCGVCVLIKNDLDNFPASVDGELPPNHAFFATGGTVTITALTPNVVGTITNATFAHVIQAPMNPYQLTPVADGCVTAVTAASFDVVAP